jgi:DNA-directed RNA polymerase subunit RPC12/RpoP
MSDSASDLLAHGIGAAKAKEKDEARFYLEWVLRSDGDPDQKIKAWLWLSEISDDPAEKRDCLENILAHEPSNPLARRGLAILNGRLDPADIIDPDHLLPAEPAPPPQPAQARRFVCQQCGGRLAFDPDGKTLTCSYCRSQQTLYQAIQGGAVVEEQDFAVALATAKGHTHPVAMQSFKCQACGVSFVLGPGVLSLSCPYCASAYIVKLAETRQLVAPHGIIPFGITQAQAAQNLARWLKENALPVKAGSPLGLYLPAWTFDVGGEIQWRAMRLEHGYGSVTWAPGAGGYPIFYNDIVVPASHTLPANLADELQHYQLEALVPYDPGYLADWPAEVHHISAADASLVARRQAWEQARSEAATRADIEMSDAQDLSFSSASMVIESFKLILLPMWIGRYHRRDRAETAMINGQTGRVRSEAPRPGVVGWLHKMLGEAI